jgi:uncharacterized protein YicC (UPF0701 family)
MSDRLDEIFNTLEMLVNGSNPTNYIMGDEPKMKQRYDAFIEAKQALQSYIDSKIIEELEKFDAMKPETGAYLSDMIADRIAELRKTL